MIAPDLPAAIQAALDARLEGVSQTNLAQRAQAISGAYRAGAASFGIATADDALAYALARMPATYAAAAACLNALIDVRPDFAPQSLLDCGAGPGTATWAAREAFPSLRAFSMIDANPALRELAVALAGTLRIDVHHDLNPADRTLQDARCADLVIASYMIGEIGDAARDVLADALWDATRDTLLIVEPGTPAGYARIVALRDRLIAQGARVAAPCPHDARCPLMPPDWCHFAQRLPRSRAHRQIKGADLAYEDEKFSYVALTRREVQRPASRVLAPPLVTKVAVTTKLCTSVGLEYATAPRRNKQAYTEAKKRDWGDAVNRSEE